jgi:MFS family permease
MPIIVAPAAGVLADKIGSRPVVFTGLALQGIGLIWLAEVVTPTVAFSHLIAPFVICGFGMAAFFAPTAALVLSTVRREEEGIASGAANAMRELGGVFGVAVLASVFSSYGSYLSPHTFQQGLRPAVLVGGILVLLAALVLLAVPRRAAMVPSIEALDAYPSQGGVTGTREPVAIGA